MGPRWLGPVAGCKQKDTLNVLEFRNLLESGQVLLERPHAKGAKDAKENTQTNALSPIRVCPTKCLPSEARHPTLSFHESKLRSQLN